MKTPNSRTSVVACLVIGSALTAATVGRADVTVEQKTNLDVASVIRMHGTMTSNVTADKKREDTESHCEGVMSLVCGNLKGGDIVRLDRGLTWRLQPDKKTYREEMFATPEERSQMHAKMQTYLEIMRSCPATQTQQPIDKSKCSMSAPKIDIRKTDDKMSIAGHDARRTLGTLTESCTDKDSGDVCDMVVAIDVWLTQDQLPGAGDRRAFNQAYAKKLGLEDAQGMLSGDYAKYLAPYQSQISQLMDKSSDFKGQPLKTSLRVMMGGPQCSTAKTKDKSSANNDGAATADNPMANVAQAGKVLGSALGGLFHKKKADDSSATQAPPAAAVPADTANSADPFAKYVQLAGFTTETMAINTDAIPADRFEVPADWKKELPKPSKKGDEEFTCPKSGS